MHWLEHRIPPPLVGAVVGVAMWVAASHGPPLALDPAARRVIAGCLVAVGIAFDLAGLWAFRASRTTVNPLAPQRASTLVTAGVYRITRNPMYVGLCCILLGWAVFLAAWLPLLGPPVYVLYITRFQILPEERVLRQLFGERYARYADRVRRWL